MVVQAAEFEREKCRSGDLRDMPDIELGDE